VGLDAFETSRDMYDLIFMLARTLFYLWFLVIPLGLLYVLNADDVKDSLRVSTVHMKSKSGVEQSLFNAMMEIMVSGLIIIVVGVLREMRPDMLSLALLVCLCHIGYTLSMKTALKYPGYFWACGICFIAPSLILNPLYYDRLYISGTRIFDIDHCIVYIIIYMACFAGGFNGRRFILNHRQNG
jgi:hypothetical protein